MLWTIAEILIILWLLGVLISAAGSFIHLLLVAAVLMIAYNLFFRGRRSRI